MHWSYKSCEDSRWEPRRIGVGGVQEAGEEGTGSRSSKRAGSQRELHLQNANFGHL